MRNAFTASRLDVRAFARASGRLEGRNALTGFERIMQECEGSGRDVMVAWSAHGENRGDGSGEAQVWLHLRADVTLPLTCQRCLDVVDAPLRVDRWFRFVPDEEAASAQDDDAEEDLLVLAGELNLHQLIEDELVLELPLIARHDACPSNPRLAAIDPAFDASGPARPNPFAALARLKPSANKLAGAGSKD